MKNRPLFTLLVSFLLTNISFAQLDSLHISHNFNTIENPDSPGDSLEVLDVYVWVNDSSDVGSVQISITDSIGIDTYGFLIRDSIDFLTHYQASNGGQYAFQFSRLPVQSLYRIDVTLTNSLGYFLSEQELVIPSN